jgi:hypothetical protein
MLIGRYHALLDANVLHPAFVRAAMLWFADERLFRPGWSPMILEEWRGSIKRRHPDLNDEKINEWQQLMTDQFPDANITGYESIVDGLPLPDLDDRHVLAAAIVGKCQGIVTTNLKHFPAAAVAPFTMDIIHPDDFIVNIIDIDPVRALTACRRHREAMKATAPTTEEFLERFAAAGLVQAHARLSANRELL